MLKKYATDEQIELLKHDFFQEFIRKLQAPFDLLREYQCDFLEQYGHISPELGYPMELQNLVSLFQNAEARFILQCLAGFSDILLLWGIYVPFDRINLVNRVLTQPDPHSGYAYVLHEDQHTGLLWIDWISAEECPSPDTDILSIKCLCKDLRM